MPIHRSQFGAQGASLGLGYLFQPSLLPGNFDPSVCLVTRLTQSWRLVE
jgi:hypothetical protein